MVNPQVVAMTLNCRGYPMKLALPVSLVGILLAGCAAPSEPAQVGTASRETAARPAPGAAPATPAEPLQLGEAANGTTIMLEPGQGLAIELLATPTAGYLWKAHTVPAVLGTATEGWRPEIERDPNGPQMTGGNSYQKFTFASGEAGEGQLVLIYGRPWELERGGRPERTFRVTISRPAQ
jgi:predicted secreted protein